MRVLFEDPFSHHQIGLASPIQIPIATERGENLLPKNLLGSKRNLCLTSLLLGIAPYRNVGLSPKLANRQIGLAIASNRYGLLNFERNLLQNLSLAAKELVPKLPLYFFIAYTEERWLS